MVEDFLGKTIPVLFFFVGVVAAIALSILMERYRK